ncbi:hypothetical protein [Mycolicibacterium gadium]|uniref:hypothetical protein n=1 Tax=Mycolicibacterium gadium TaxID=1794 RepID=UPI001D73A340|nr:hypothetical protein [Mycobacteriaceae bacterium]
MLPIYTGSRTRPDTAALELLDAAVAGLQIPDAVAARWGLDLTAAPLDMSR